MNLEDIKEVLAHDKEKTRTDPRLYISWRNVYNENFPSYPICGSCGDGFGVAYDFMSATYYQLIKNKKQNKMDSNSQFKLKDQGTIQCSHGSISNANITDEIAIELLQISENYITAFEKFPTDWKELVAKTPTLVQKMAGQMSMGSSSEGNDISTMTKAQLQEYAKSQGFAEEDYSKLNKTDLLEFLQS